MDCLRFNARCNYIGQLLAKVEKDIGGSKEQFILHYKAKYTEPRLPPAWMMVENRTLGSLSHLFAGLLNTDRKAVAAPFGCDEHFLKSWLHSLTYVRNLCAHHARLWHRTFSIKPLIAKKHSAFLHHSQADRFCTLTVVLFELVEVVSPATCWHRRLKARLTAHPAVPLSTWGSRPTGRRSRSGTRCRPDTPPAGKPIADLPVRPASLLNLLQRSWHLDHAVGLHRRCFQ